MLHTPDIESIRAKLEQQERQIPWITHLVMAVVALLGSVGIITFFTVMRLFDEKNVLFFGIAAIVWVLAMGRDQKESLTQYYGYFVLLLAGEIGIAIGLVGNDIASVRESILTVGVLQIALFFMVEDYMQRILNLTIFTFSILFFIPNPLMYGSVMNLFIPFYTGAILFLVFRAKRVFSKGWYYDLHDALLINLFLLILTSVARQYRVAAEHEGHLFLFISSALLGFYTLHTLLGRYSGRTTGAYVTAALLMGLFYLTPELIIAFIILALGGYGKNYRIMTAALAVIVLFLAHWYYNLEFTLLQKSLSMMLAGAVMLGLYAIRRITHA